MPQSSQSNHHRPTSSTTLNKKRHSGNGRPVLIRKNTSSKSLGRKRESVEYSSQGEDEEGMAASFLQFCATCERQIVVPNTGVLYCSESCRRSDSASSTTRPLSFTLASTHSQKPLPDLIPPRSPTVIHKPYTFQSSTVSQLSGQNPLKPGLNEASSGDHSTSRPQSSRPTTATPSLSFSPSSYASSSAFSPTTKVSQSLGHTRRASTKSIDLVTPTAACPTAPASLEAQFKGSLHLGDWRYASSPKQLVADDDDAEELGRVITYGKHVTNGGGGAASSSLKHLLNGDKSKSGHVK